MYDFATSDDTYSQLIPMEVDAYERNGYVCSVFSRMDKSQSYFPIIRENDWADARFELLDASSTGKKYIYVLFH